MPDHQTGWAYESRIEPSQLQLGHFVIRLDIPWSETRFPLQGVLVDSLEKKRWMSEHCAWVVISHERSSNKTIPSRRLPPIGEESGSGGRSGGYVGAPLSINGEVDAESLEVALSVYGSLDERVRDLAEQIRSGRGVDAGSARSVVGELAGVLHNHSAALVWLTRIKERDDYTAQHCINASILSIGLAYALNWDERKIEHAGLAGLLHDLGKLKIDDAILNKPGPLTDEEYEIIKTHAALGYELLVEEGGLPSPVMEAVLHHHERPDGLGYPHGLSRGQIPLLARLIGIVDAYDAITSHRVYDPARSHHDALGILWKQRNKQFDGPMVEAFTQYLGWVTPGTLVRLTNGSLALVLKARDGRGLLPLVRLLHDEGGEYQLGDTLDLSGQRPDSGDAPVRVAEVLPDGAHGVDIRQLSRAFD